jgi:DNA-directed RNA polymerase alpha subunit
MVQTRINNMDISTRLLNVCIQREIETVEDLFKFSVSELLTIKNIGIKTIYEIEQLRLKYGYDSLFISEFVSEENKIRNISISKRLSTVCKRNSINTIEELFSLDLIDLKKLKHLGTKTLEEISRLKLIYSDTSIEVNTGNKSKVTFDFESQLTKMDRDQILRLQIKNLSISNRLKNKLTNLNIFKISDFLKKRIRPNEFANIRGIGIKTVSEYAQFAKVVQDAVGTESSTNDAQFPVQNHFGTETLSNVIDLTGLPHKIADIELSFFNLPPSLNSFFHDNELIRIRDLNGYNPNSYFLEKRASSSILYEFIKSVNSREVFEKYPPSKPEYFPMLIDNYIGKQKENVKIILEQKFSDKDVTLEGIGKQNNITRERVRQIIKKSVNNFLRVNTHFVAKAEQYYIDNIFSTYKPINSKELLIKIIDDGIYEFKYSDEFYIRFLKYLLPGILFSHNEEILNPNISGIEKKIESQIDNYMKQRVPVIIPKNYLKTFLQKELKMDSYLCLKVIILSNKISFKVENSMVLIHSLSIPFYFAAEAIFKSAGYPLTIQEFKKRLHKYFSKFRNLNDENTIRPKLIGNPKIFRLDNNLYCDYEQLEWTLPDLSRLLDSCYEKMKEKNIPTAIYDLTYLLSNTTITLPFELSNNNYILDAAISTDKRFVKLGRLTYGLKEWGTYTLDTLSNLAFQIIKNNKRPKPFADIYKETLKKRSVLEISLNTVLNSDNRFIRYSTNWWGLKLNHNKNLLYLLENIKFLDYFVFKLKPETRLVEVLNNFDENNSININDLREALEKVSNIVVYNHDNHERVFHKKWKTSKIVSHIIKKFNSDIDIHEILNILNGTFGQKRFFSLKEVQSAISAIAYYENKDLDFIFSEQASSKTSESKELEFIKNNILGDNTIIDLEEIYDFYIDIVDPESETSLDAFRNIFENNYRNQFEEISLNLYRRSY